MMRRGALLAAAIVAACGGSGDASRGVPETTSLLGEPLYTPPLSDAVRARYDSLLRVAEADVEAHPGDVDAIIWLGRRTAYLGHYRAALAIYTEGIPAHPNDPRLYRHRGHRYITLRQFDDAITDFERAAQLFAGQPDEVEPDGLPNVRNIPTSTLQFNVWYHLGLAHYLKGDFTAALEAYRRCLAVSTNPDALVATSHWLYMTLRRLGDTTAAAGVLRPISAGLDVIENESYHRLLLMYRGEVPPDSLFRLVPGEEARIEAVTAAYGVGNWHLYNGRPGEAERIFRVIVGATGQWPAFGYIAAEAELARPGERYAGDP